MGSCIIFGDSGEKEKMEKRTSVLSIEPGPSDWKSCMYIHIKHQAITHDKIHLPILSYVLPVCVDHSVNIPLSDHLHSVLSEPL